MRDYGFSTGALSGGDFRSAIEILAKHEVRAIELSALRAHELAPLMAGLDVLDLSRYAYVSIHAPSRFDVLSEKDVATLLLPCIDFAWNVVVHPGSIRDVQVWEPFGALLCIENMDKRKPGGRTARELEVWFERLPEASFCLDLAHARQVDPSMSRAYELVRQFGTRIRQIHLSELNARSQHEPLTIGAVLTFADIAQIIPAAPVILENVVEPDRVASQLRLAQRIMEPHQNDRLPAVAVG